MGFSANCDDEIFTYSVEYLVGGVVQPPLSFVTYDNILKVISVYSTNMMIPAGTYNMRLKGVINNFQEAYSYFDIKIINSCTDLVIETVPFLTP